MRTRVVEIQLQRSTIGGLGASPVPVAVAFHSGYRSVGLRQVVIDSQCSRGELLRMRKRLLRRKHSLKRELDIRIGQAGIGRRVARIARQSRFEVGDALVEILRGELVRKISAFEIVPMSLGASRL